MNRFLLAAAAALALTATEARAQPASAGTDNLSGWLVFDPGGPGGIGLGGRYMIPLVPEGLLRGQGIRFREELSLEVGADFIHWSYEWPYYGTYGWQTYDYSVNALEVVAGVMWNWWLTPRLAVYPKLDLGYSFAWVSDWPGQQYGYGSPSYSDVFVNGAVGLIYKLQSVSLRVEAGSHTLRVGAGVKF